MKLFDILSILVTVSAIFSYVNYRFLRLPATIGLMLIALVLSMGLIALDYLGMSFKQSAADLLSHIDFNETLLHGMLSFLLFAGAIHVDLEDLKNRKYIITILATFGVVVSTLMIGGISWWVLGFLGLNLPFIHCLLFGALISPTDPIAVLSILKHAKVPKSLETVITGESLFNDGVAVVVFLVLMGIADGGQGHDVSVSGTVMLFVKEVLGGVLFGLALGTAANWMMKTIDNYQVELFITLAVVTGGFSLANALHLSGPIAVVVAGLQVGNHGRTLAMSAITQAHIDDFWEFVDDILNAVLFVLIGMEVLVLTFSGPFLIAGIIMIPVVLGVRFLSVGFPVILLRRFRDFSPNIIKILTWGGLRGGISVAMALSLPEGPSRDVLIAVTYSVVVFSILVQGMTVGKLVRLKNPPFTE
jgi:CPA1 family monovalent cation:H+ antiporter